MKQIISNNKRIISWLLAFIIIIGLVGDIFVQGSITAKAEATYNVLLWAPVKNSNNETFIDKFKNHYENANISVEVEMKSNDLTLNENEIKGKDMIYILPNSVEVSYSLIGGSNVTLLKKFLKAGGRLVLNGESTYYASKFNISLNTLATKLNAGMQIVSDTNQTHDVDLNGQMSDLLTNCSNIYPSDYSYIQLSAGSTAVWLIKGKTDGKIIAANQKIEENGNLTMISDATWLNPYNAPDSATTAAKAFLTNIVKDSAENMDKVVKLTVTVTSPANVSWTKGDTTARTLSVTTAATYKGTVTYQWHKGNSANFTPGESTQIAGATGNSYAIPNPGSVEAGTYYYKCVVTNKSSSATDTVASGTIVVTVNALPAQQPTITGPGNLEWDETDSTPRTVSINASVSDGGTLYFQWHKGNSADFMPTTSTKIDGATNKDYSIPNPASMGPGTYYYKCVVTNTTGSSVATATSNAAAVTVKALPDRPDKPVVTGPQNLEWFKGDATQRILSVTASASNVGTMTYQWYKGTSADFTPDTSSLISGATGANYTIPNPGAMAVGRYYYKCKVTNTKNSINEETISQAANVVVLTVVGQQPYTEPEPADGPGQMDVSVDKKDDTPEVEVRGLTEELAWTIVNEEERKEISKGSDGRLFLEITNIDNTVNEADKNKIIEEAKILNDAKIGMYMDFSMYFQLGKGYKRKITELNGRNIKATVTVPDNLLTTEKKRTFYLVSVHNGLLRIHGSSLSEKINVSLYDFSTYAIIYADEEEEVLQANIKIKQTNDKIIVEWDKITDVGKVDVYVAYCGTKYTKKPTKTTKSRRVVITSIRGKRLNQKRNYKMYLVAYTSSGTRIGKTLSCHFAGKNCKYTNPKKIKLNTNALTVKVGESANIKGTIKYENKKKKPLSIKHAPRFRYVSDIPEIVAVDKNGNITGLSPGVSDVYVCGQNGIAKHVTVTVTE